MCDASVLPLVPYVGAFDDAVSLPAFAPLAARLGRPAVAVNLAGPGPLTHRRLLALRPKRLIAFAHPRVPDSRHGATWRLREPDAERWCRLLRAFGMRVDQSDVRLIPPTLPVPSCVRGATLIHPGSGRGGRFLPAPYWITLARMEWAAGRPVVVTGGERDAGLASAVAAGAGLSVDRVFAGRLSVEQMAALVAGAERVATTDGGVGLLALSLGRPWLRGLEVERPAASRRAAAAALA